MIWLCRVNVAGNWTGHAHLFEAQGKTRALCKSLRFDGEDWRPAPLPLMQWSRCEHCGRIKHEDNQNETQ